MSNSKSPAFMPPTSKTLRGHIGGACPWSVCAGVRPLRLHRSRTVKDRILKFNIWNKHEK